MKFSNTIKPNKADNKGKVSPNELRLSIPVALMLGFILIIVFGLTKIDSQRWIGTLMLVSFASVTLGSLLGFLFGIPKVASQNNENAIGDKTFYTVNTSLEQISDWLTKIIIGVGLTQLTNIPSYLHHIAVILIRGIDCKPECSDKDITVLLAILVFFTIVGFFLGYLFARIFLVKLFRDAEDVEKLEEELDETRSEIKEIISNDPSLLRKKLSIYQKEILLKLVGQSDKTYKLSDDPLSTEQFSDLNKLLNWGVIELASGLGGSQINSGANIKISNSYALLTPNEIL
jgi:hypothetical protein